MVQAFKVNYKDVEYRIVFHPPKGATKEEIEAEWERLPSYIQKFHKETTS